MGYITLGVLGLTLLTLAIGFLAGFIRGFKRSVLSSIITIAGIAVILIFQGSLINFVKGIEISGKTVEAIVSEAIDSIFSGEDMQKFESIVEQVKLLVDGIVGVIVYIAVYVVVRFISTVLIYPICKIFVRKSPFGRKKRLLGCIVGVATSVIICITFIGPISGLIYNVTDIVTPVMELSQSMKDDSSTSESEDDATKNLLETIGLIGEKSYNNSQVGGAYRNFSSWYYKIVSSSSNENGETTDLDTQLGAIAGVAKTAGSMAKFKDLDLDGLFNDELSSEEREQTKQDFINIGKEMDASMGSMTPEQKKEAGKLLGSALSGLISDTTEGDDGLSSALESISFDDVSFENEFSIIADLSEIKNSEGEGDQQETINQVVEGIANSDVICDLKGALVENEGKAIAEYDEEQKAMIMNAINGLEDQEKKDKVTEFFFGKN